MNLRLHRALWLPATGLSLVACSQLPGRDDLAGPPGATYQSGKSPTAFVQCLTPKWKSTKVVGGDATVETVPGPAGSVRMTLKIAGAPGRVLEILPQAGGSSIRYWNRSHDFGGGGATRPAAVQAIEDCR